MRFVRPTALVLLALASPLTLAACGAADDAKQELKDLKEQHLTDAQKQLDDARDKMREATDGATKEAKEAREALRKQVDDAKQKLEDAKREAGKLPSKVDAAGDPVTY